MSISAVMLSRYSSKEEPLEMELTSGLPETELFSGFTVTKVTSELPELPEKSLNLKPPETEPTSESTFFATIIHKPDPLMMHN